MPYPLRFRVPGSMLTDALQRSVGGLSNTIANIPQMIQEQEDRKRRQKLEDERTIRENSLVELRNRSVTSEEELARARDLRERETHKQRKTLFDRESVDYDANALVRERARNEGLIRGGFRERREGVMRSLDDPAFLPIRERIMGARDDEDEFERRLAAEQANIDNIRKQIEEGRAKNSLRLAYAQKGPMPWDVAAKMNILERTKEEKDRVRQAKLLNEQLKSEHGQLQGIKNSLSGTPFDLPRQLGLSFLPSLQSVLQDETPDPEIQSGPFWSLPVGITEGQRAVEDFKRAQAEKARKEPVDAYAESRAAQRDARQREKIAATLQSLSKGTDPNVVMAQLEALGLSDVEAAELVSKATGE